MLRGTSLVLLAFAAASASAQNYPVKPIRITTSGAGGGNDIKPRVISAGVTGPLGQPVIVDNRVGFVSAEVVAKAPPDGYTLLVAGSTHWLAPYLYPSIPFDPVRDFAPVTMADRSPATIVVHPSVPAKSVKELIALAKAKPGQLNYASNVNGSPNHLAGELFKYLAGVNIVRIAYKSAGQARSDVVSGEVQMQFPSAGSAMPYVKAGKLRALGVGSKEPSVLAPGIPPIGASLPGYEAASIRAVFAPNGTPAAIVSRLNQEMVRFLRSPDVKQKLLADSTEAVGSTPEELAATIKSEMPRMGKVIKAAGIRAE